MQHRVRCTEEMTVEYKIVSLEGNSLDLKMTPTPTALRRKTVYECVSDLLGLDVIESLHRDAKILILCKTVRMFGFGFLSVMVWVL